MLPWRADFRFHLPHTPNYGILPTIWAIFWPFPPGGIFGGSETILWNMWVSCQISSYAWFYSYFLSCKHQYLLEEKILYNLRTKILLWFDAFSSLYWPTSRLSWWELSFWGFSRLFLVSMLSGHCIVHGCLWLFLLLFMASLGHLSLSGLRDGWQRDFII